ncbi:transcriptional regulator [Clostridia bacterium]|nr:transcriptional regulator [Clostridia bacterium]
MAISYKKLWHLLIDKDLKKQDLRTMSGIAPASMAKLAKGDTITTETLEKVCNALNCDISDIMEIVPDKKNKQVEENTE